MTSYSNLYILELLFYIVSKYLPVLFIVVPFYTVPCYIMWRQRVQNSVHMQDNAAVSPGEGAQSHWVLLWTNHTIASQNKYPIRHHMLRGLCLCFDSTHPVCLQAAILTLPPGACVWGWAIFHKSPRLLLVDTPQLDTTVTVSHLFPLCLPSVRSVWCQGSAVLCCDWLTSQCQLLF